MILLSPGHRLGGHDCPDRGGKVSTNSRIVQWSWWNFHHLPIMHHDAYLRMCYVPTVVKYVAYMYVSIASSTTKNHAYKPQHPSLQQWPSVCFIFALLLINHYHTMIMMMPQPCQWATSLGVYEPPRVHDSSDDDDDDGPNGWPLTGTIGMFYFYYIFNFIHQEKHRQLYLFSDRDFLFLATTTTNTPFVVSLSLYSIF